MRRRWLRKSDGFERGEEGEGGMYAYVRWWVWPWRRDGFERGGEGGRGAWRLVVAAGLAHSPNWPKVTDTCEEPYIAVVVLADRVCRETCASRAVTAYISAAQRIGWGFTVGDFFPVVTTEGGAGFSAPLRSLYDRFPAGSSARGGPAEPFHDALLLGGVAPSPEPWAGRRWTRS